MNTSHQINRKRSPDYPSEICNGIFAQGHKYSKSTHIEQKTPIFQQQFTPLNNYLNKLKNKAKFIILIIFTNSLQICGKYSMEFCFATFILLFSYALLLRYHSELSPNGSGLPPSPICQKGRFLIEACIFSFCLRSQY